MDPTFAGFRGRRVRRFSGKGFVTEGTVDKKATPRGWSKEYRFRAPVPADGAAIWELVRDSGELEPNTPYCYILFADHFAETCVLAERDGRIVGIVVGFMSPRRPGSVFVWQIGVAASERGRGLAKALISELLTRPCCKAVTHLEATVGVSNAASERLFRSVARDLGAICDVTEGFREDLFPGGGHEAERLFTIGPIASQKFMKGA